MNSIRELLDMYEIDPKKSLGQNFLHDPNALDRILKAADLQPGDTVVEVGPGTGALTVKLAPLVERVIAVELDDRLLPILEDVLPENVELLHADILNTAVEALVGEGAYKVVANLPYYITSAILRHLLEVSHKPTTLVLTVQQEVAERMVAKPGDMTVLAVSVQYYGKPKIVSKIGAAAFYPQPDVASAIVRIDVYPQLPVDVPSDEAFFKVVRAGFSQKRKQLKNSLGDGLQLPHATAAEHLTAAGIDPMRRAETLALEEWAALTRQITPSAQNV
jgi:16S rRNA (adenine1518-N6/adenine1519-N6)-dimethyltransferase